MIAVIDYGMGNLRSVSKAIEHLGYQVETTGNPLQIQASDGIIVPGVGSFGKCIRNLKEQNLLIEIENSIKQGKPYLGICLGLQLLFEYSEESPDTHGLGIFKGKIIKFPEHMKVPHMGWNNLKIKKSNILFDNIPDDRYFYFVHSYYPVPYDNMVISGTTNYNKIDFCSAISMNNIYATQFHPEKSQNIGLKVLNNFCQLCKGEKT